MAQTVKITPASGLLEFIGNTTSNKPYLQHDDNGNLTLTLQSAKKFTVAGNLKVNGKVTMAQQTLTDGAAITWDFNSGANAKVTIAGARTLVISNMEAGDTGLLLVKQDAAGSRTLSLPGSSSIVGGGSYTASTAANATDVLGVYYDGTTYWWTIGYNTVTPPLTSVGITGSDFVIANSPLTANGNIGLSLATVNSNVGSFGSASAVPVITVNAKGLITAVSTTNISIPTNLDSLTDVTISSATTGQLLQYNGSQWVNWTPNYLTGITSAQVTTALGYTPYNATNPAGYITSAALGNYVSYTGATQDLNMGTFGLVSDYVRFNLSSSNIPTTPGTLSWNDVDGTLDLKLKGGNVTLQIGQEQLVRIVNDSGGDLLESQYHVVFIKGAQGSRLKAGLAIADNTIDSKSTIGMVTEDIQSGGEGFVTSSGLVHNINTTGAMQGENWSNGDVLWLSPINAGHVTNIQPVGHYHKVVIGYVTNAHPNNGTIYVKISVGTSTWELNNVSGTQTANNGDIFKYNSANLVWEAGTIAGVLGYTPANDANTVHKTGAESIAGVKTFTDTTQSTSITSGGLVTNGGVGIAKNLYVGGNINVIGNLTIGGTTTTINAQNLSVSDNMIYLNNGISTTITNVVANGSTIVYTTAETHNYTTGMSVSITGVDPTAFNLSNQTITAVTTNSFTIASAVTGSYVSGGTARAKSNANPDLGWAGGYNSGSYAHTGLFRDATDDTFKFFKGYTPEPDASPFIDVAHASFAYADVRGYNITGNSFIKSGGTSSQFLKADGSVDSTVYASTAGSYANPSWITSLNYAKITGGTSAQFLKADGSVDSTSYLSQSAAAASYQPLDADLTAIAGLSSTGFLKRTGANTWSLDTNTYLTSYTETDTLATVTGRGATTSTAVTFSGGASISNLLVNGAPAVAEASLALGAMGTGEGGQLVLNKATSYTYAAHLDVWQDVFRILYGTNTATSGVAMSLNLSTRQLILPAYTTSSSFSGTATGVLGFDSSGNVITLAIPSGAVSSVNAGTGVSVSSTTGAVTVSIGQSVATSATPSFDKVFLTNNGGGTNLKVGDDVWIGDVNRSNVLGLVGQQDSTAGYIAFGTTDVATVLGRTGTGALTWGGNTIYHAGNLTNLNQLTNGPGYITGYTETDTLQTVTARGATTSIASSFTGGATITGLTVAKSGTDSLITFPAQTNDPGYIKHYESSNTAIMYFSVSDDSTTTDYFTFGSTNAGTYSEGLRITSSGIISVGTWQGTSIADSYISSASTWNAKQAALSGSGIVKSASGTISYISGTSSQFVKGDGSLDSSTYLTTGTASSTYLTISTASSTYLTISTASSTYLPLAGGTITGKVTFPSTYDRRPQFPGGILGLNTGDGDFDIWGISQEYYPSHATPQNAWGLRWNGTNNDFEFVGAGTNRVILDMDSGNITSTGSVTASSFIRPGGTSSQFLKADGSLDSSTYLTGITSTQVTNALGYTPYNSTNPSGYITGINSGNVTTALGYTPVTNARTLTINGTTYDLTANRSWTVGDVLTSSTYANPSWITSLAWSKITGTPTTLSGYGITDAASSTHTHYIGTTQVQASSASQALTGISGITFVAQSTDSASITTTISGTSTFFDFNLADDNSNDEWRWRFTPSGSSIYDAMRLVPVSNTASNLIVSGTITGSQIIKSGGTSSQFLKADGSVDSSTYATQSWVSSQGYLTSVSDVWVNTSGDTMTGQLRIDLQNTINTTTPGTGTGYGLHFGGQATNDYATGITFSAGGAAGANANAGIYVQGSGNYGTKMYIATTDSYATGSKTAISIDHGGNVNIVRGVLQQGGNQVWHAGNDGAGSGLDADLLDGHNSSTSATANTIAARDGSGNLYANYILGSYFNSSAGNSENPTIGQIWTQNTSDNYLRKSTPSHFRSQVTDGYYLPITGGTITGTVDLSNNTLQGVGHIIMADSGFQEGIQWENWFICDSPDDNSNQAGNLQFVYVHDNSIRMTFDTTGTLTLSNRLIELSSIRYKTQVESLTPALDKVMHLRPVTYVKIDGPGTTEIGLIAEEVAEIYPELIKYNAEGQVDGINYTRIAPILIKTIQEQQELIKKLTERIENLENR